MDIIRHLSSLRGSPWRSERRPLGGFKLFHRTTERDGREGNVRIRKTKKTEDGHKLLQITSVGIDENKLASEFIEWLLTHFRQDTIRIIIK